MYFIILCLYIISLTTIMEQVREVSDLPLLTMGEHTRKTRCHTSCISIFILYVKIIFAGSRRLSKLWWVMYIHVRVGVICCSYKSYTIPGRYDLIPKTSNFNFISYDANIKIEIIYIYIIIIRLINISVFML